MDPRSKPKIPKNKDKNRALPPHKQIAESKTATNNVTSKANSKAR